MEILLSRGEVRILLSRGEVEILLSRREVGILLSRGEVGILLSRGEVEIPLVGDPIIKRGGWDPTGLSPPHVCACPTSNPISRASYVAIHFFIQLR